jgi:hypothetical protein
MSVSFIVSSRKKLLLPPFLSLTIPVSVWHSQTTPSAHIIPGHAPAIPASSETTPVPEIGWNAPLADAGDHAPAANIAPQTINTINPQIFVHTLESSIVYN